MPMPIDEAPRDNSIKMVVVYFSIGLAVTVFLLILRQVNFETSSEIPDNVKI